jgi:hypothetical protein
VSTNLNRERLKTVLLETLACLGLIIILYAMFMRVSIVPSFAQGAVLAVPRGLKMFEVALATFS